MRTYQKNDTYLHRRHGSVSSLKKGKLPSRLEVTKSANVSGPSINLRRRASMGEMATLNINRENQKDMMGRKELMSTVTVKADKIF